MIKINKTKAWQEKNEKDWHDTSTTRPHAMNIDWLMNDQDAAIDLQLRNLIATYGEEKVSIIFNLMKSLRRVG